LNEATKKKKKRVNNPSKEKEKLPCSRGFLRGQGGDGDGGHRAQRVNSAAAE